MATCTASAAAAKPRLVYEGAFVIATPDSLAGVAVSPDGARIAVCYGDESEQGRSVVRVYVVDTRRPKRRSLVLETDQVNGVAWSPDGKRLAVCAASELVVIRAMDKQFRACAIQRVQTAASGPVLFSERGDWMLAKSAGGGIGDFTLVRFGKLGTPDSSDLHLEIADSASLIRYPGNRIAVVGLGLAVDRDGTATAVKPTGANGLYALHTDPVAGGRWFLSFDLETPGDDAALPETHAWLEDVLTGKRIPLKWPKDMRVTWVQATGPASFCLQADEETLLGGKLDRFRRYHLAWR